MANFQEDKQTIIDDYHFVKKNKRTILANSKEHTEQVVRNLVNKVEHKSLKGMQYFRAEFKSKMTKNTEKSYLFRFKMKHSSKLSVRFDNYTDVTGISAIKKYMFDSANGHRFEVKISDDYPMYILLSWDSYGFPKWYLVAKQEE